MLVSRIITTLYVLKPFAYVILAKKLHVSGLVNPYFTPRYFHSHPNFIAISEKKFKISVVASQFGPKK